MKSRFSQRSLLLAAILLVGTFGVRSIWAGTTNIISHPYGPALIGSGTTSLITNGASLSGAITNNGQLLFRQSSSLSDAFPISGTGSLTQSGSGTTSLDAGISYAGGTSVSAGTLQIGSGGSSNILVGNGSGEGGNLSITGGTLNNAVGIIGENTGSRGSALVENVSSLWSNQDELIVGYLGSGDSLVISNGGKVIDASPSYASVIGYDSNSSNNIILVMGTNANASASSWSNSSDLYVGFNGSSNSLFIGSGGEVANANAWIGYEAGASNNTVLLVGAGSRWSNSGSLVIGYYGSDSSLVISNGGQVVNGVENPGGFIGYDTNSSNNSLVITGTNAGGTSSTLNNNTDLYVGYGGSGNSLIISNGAQVSVDNSTGSNGMIIGYAQGSSNNLVTLSDTGSSLQSGSDLIVGYGGYGNTLVISNGAQELNNIYSYSNSYGGVIGLGSNATGNSALVTGSNSLWYNYGPLSVGYAGSESSLVISNGGEVVTGYTGESAGSIGYLSSGNSVLVTGSNSLWYSYGDIQVGYFGSSNTLAIGAGGEVDAINSTIGTLNTSSNNSVTISGTNSLWDSSGILTVGGYGSGTVTLGTGGAVEADVGIVIAYGSNSAGTLNFGIPGGKESGISLIAPDISFGSGSGSLNFNQSDTATITSSISGIGTLSQNGSGTTVLTASNPFTGTMIITAGTLSLSSEASISATTINLGTKTSQGTFDVSSQSAYTLTTNQTLSGYGVINAGAGVVMVNGNINPGSIDGISRGLITITGNLALGSSSVTTLSLTSTNSAGTDYDALRVSGNLTYNGELRLVVNTPAIGVFDLFGAGSFTDGLKGVALAGSWNPGPFTLEGTGLWSYTSHDFDWVFSENQGTLTVSLVPEPGEFALLVAGLFTWFIVRRITVYKNAKKLLMAEIPQSAMTA